MRVLKTQIKDFRVLRNKGIEFDKNKPIVLVKGSNGSGKSSILKAINFLLFNVKQDESAFKDFIRKGAKESFVSTEFESNGKTFLLDAVIGKTVSRRLVYEGELFENTQSLSKLPSIIPGYQLGIQASTSFQGMTDLISATPAERRSMLEKVFQINLATQVEDLQNDTKTKQDEIKEIEKEAYHLENSQKPLQRFVHDCGWTDKEQGKKIEEYDELNKQLGSFEKLESLKGIIKTNENKMSELKNLLSGFDNKNFTINRQCGKYGLVCELGYHEKSLGDVKVEVSNLTRELEGYLKDKEWYEQGICPTCNEPIKDADKKLEELLGLIEGLNQDLRGKEGVCEDLKSVVADHRNTIENIVKANNAVKEAIRRERYERKKRIDWELELKNLEEQTKELVASLPENDSDMVSVKERLKGLKDDIDRYRDQETRRKLIEKTNMETKKFNEESRLRLLSLSAKKEELLLSCDTNVKAQAVLTRDFPSWVLMKESKYVEAEMNSFLDEAYGGRYHVTIDVAKAGIGIFYNQGSDVSLASGSEKDLMNLAFKMALSRLSGMNILFLDEVDKFCDVNVASNLFDVVVDQVKRGKLDQVFVVTHSVDMQNKLELLDDTQVIEV